MVSLHAAVHARARATGYAVAPPVGINGWCDEQSGAGIRLYELAHEGLAFESVPVDFTELPGVCGDRFKTVPIIEHGDTAMNENRDIAEFLDRACFRQSREARLMASLEGHAPTYADYLALSAFQWVAGVSSLPMLAGDDAGLRAWLDRGFDLHGGPSRDARATR